MAGDPVKFERLDVSEGLSLGEARNGRYACLRTQVQKELFGNQSSCYAVIQRHRDRLLLDNTGGAHDEFRPGGLVPFEVKGDQAVDHVPLAPKNLLHVDRYRAGGYAELFGAGDDPGDPGAPDFVLAGEAVDVGTGAANPAAFDNGGLLPRLGKMPGKIFATFATADDNGVVPLRFGHCCLL